MLLSIALSLLAANLLAVPQSTSQATVLALVGPATYFDMLETRRLLFEILPTWLLLPLVAFVLTYALSRVFYAYASTITTPDRVGPRRPPPAALRALVLLSACYVSFAIGSNNVANAAGPITSMVTGLLPPALPEHSLLMIMTLSTLVVAPCFGIGSQLLGGAVLQSTGKQLVSFGPLGATLISLVTASLLLLASVTRGIPTSLVQLNVASILALGVARHGWRGLSDMPSLPRFLLVWMAAPLAAFALSLALTALADGMELL